MKKNLNILIFQTLILTNIFSVFITVNGMQQQPAQQTWRDWFSEKSQSFWANKDWALNKAQEMQQSLKIKYLDARFFNAIKTLESQKKVSAFQLAGYYPLYEKYKKDNIKAAEGLVITLEKMAKE